MQATDRGRDAIDGARVDRFLAAVTTLARYGRDMRLNATTGFLRELGRAGNRARVGARSHRPKFETAVSVLIEAIRALERNLWKKLPWQAEIVASTSYGAPVQLPEASGILSAALSLSRIARTRTWLLESALACGFNIFRSLLLCRNFCFLRQA